MVKVKFDPDFDSEAFERQLYEAGAAHIRKKLALVVCPVTRKAAKLC